MCTPPCVRPYTTMRASMCNTPCHATPQHHNISCHNIPHPATPYHCMPYHCMPYHCMPYHSMPSLPWHAYARPTPMAHHPTPSTQHPQVLCAFTVCLARGAVPSLSCASMLCLRPDPPCIPVCHFPLDAGLTFVLLPWSSKWMRLLVGCCGRDGSRSNPPPALPIDPRQT